MRAFLITVALLLGASVYAVGQDSFTKSFSLELGSGLQPLHMTLAPSHSEKMAFADKGLEVWKESEYCPVISVSEVWRTGAHWELCLTEGASFKFLEMRGYEPFGTDPSGKPRYSLSTGFPAGTRVSNPILSLTFQARFIWSPKWKVTVYSALGAGLTTATEFYPMPEVTPIALRFGGKHFYGFAEATLGPIATFGHGGLGWRF